MDDLSRYGYIYLTTHKSETFEKFKELQNEVENHHNRKIKFLRSDRGGEFISYEFSSRDRGYRTRRRKETSHRCCKQRGDLHNTNSRLCPNESVRLSSSPVCCNKGLNVWCGR